MRFSSSQTCISPVKVSIISQDVSSMPANSDDFLRFPALCFYPFFCLFCSKNLSMSGVMWTCVEFYVKRRNRRRAWKCSHPLQIKNSRDFSLEPDLWWKQLESNPYSESGKPLWLQQFVNCELLMRDRSCDLFTTEFLCYLSTILSHPLFPASLSLPCQNPIL